MDRTHELISNRADEIAMSFWGRPFYNLTEREQGKVLRLAEIDVRLKQAIVSVAQLNALGTSYINEFGGIA